MSKERDDALEEAARIAETMDFAIVDCGPPAEGKMISGICTFDNRGHDTPERIAAAIRALKSAPEQDKNLTPKTQTELDD